MLTREEIANRVFEILDNLGVVEKEEEKVVIHNEEIDSIQLVSIIVDIEESFNIEIPDDYMNPEFLLSFNHIVDIVEELLNVTASEFIPEFESNLSNSNSGL